MSEEPREQQETPPTPSPPPLSPVQVPAHETHVANNSAPSKEESDIRATGAGLAGGR